MHAANVDEKWLGAKRMSSDQGPPRKIDQRTIGPTTGQLIKHILAVRFADLNDEAIKKTRTFLADTLLVGVAGVCNKASDEVLQAARKWDGDRTGNCRILARPGVLLSPHSAAVLNGFQMHCLEWDALHEPSVVIALCVSSAAILSECEQHDFSMDDIVLALTVGVETAVFFGAAASSEPRFFRPSTAGLMGAAMAIGRLRAFDAARMTDLLGCAYSQVSGTMQAHWEGSDALPLQVGIAARAALTAADLVEAGISGPHDVVDGKFGYFKLIESTSGLSRHLAAWGNPWKITEVAHKPFPAGRATQATLTAIRDIKFEHDISMEDVESVTAHVPPLIMLLVGRDWRAEMPPAYARLCLQFVAPMMVRDGLIDPRAFTAERFASEWARRDAAKVHVVLDTNLDPNALGPQKIVLKLKDGTVFCRVISVPFGSPKLPLSRDDELVKGKLCFEVAGQVDRSAEVFSKVQEAGATSKMDNLIAIISGPKG